MSDKSTLAASLAERDARIADLEDRLAYAEDALHLSHVELDMAHEQNQLLQVRWRIRGSTSC